MTHPLIAFLKTPMAAPETPQLKVMRRWWMALCWSLALVVLLHPLLKLLLGPLAALPALVLMLALTRHGLVYFRAKARSDGDFTAGGQP